MTPGARVQAAIECLDQVFSGQPAEKALTNWARRSRFAGSKDRAAVRDHVYDALRARDSFAHLGGCRPQERSGRGVLIGLCRAHGIELAGVFSGVGHAPAPLTEAEQSALQTVSKQTAMDTHWDMPEWCAALLQQAYGSHASALAHALRARAPLDLRVNLRRCSVEDALATLAKDAIVAVPVADVPGALRVRENARRVHLSRAYLEGHVEIQDAGSQALVLSLPVKDGMQVLDYCAGGGGKSLALAATYDAAITAHDINAARMRDIPVRAARAGTKAIVCATGDDLPEAPAFDFVLCDAPCSGSGAWRRSPDAKWQLTAERLEELVTLQKQILRTASYLLRPGGYLAYATCSLFPSENEDQVNDFLESAPDFQRVSVQSWSPLNGTDGFFSAVLRKTD